MFNDITMAYGKYIRGGIMYLMFTIGLLSCSSQKEEKSYQERIAGKWQLTEVDRGVTCTVTFHPDNRMDVYFENAERRSKLRPGFWSISGDTIFIDEQTGRSTLIIQQIDDSLMTLRKSDSIDVFFHRVP